MADMSQVNLERLRATDAMWEENKHPRADNGQFTSGSGGGGAKVTKATPGMAGGKFGTEKSRINEAVAKNNRRAEATQAKIDAAFKNKDKVAFKEAMQEKSQGAARGLENIKNIKKTFQAAGKTLEKARPGIAKMREQVKAAGSGESHAKALENLAADFKRDPFISKYANDLAKAARSGGEAAIAKRAEEIRNEIQGANTPGFQKSVQNGRLDYVLKEYKNGMAKQPAAQPAAKPQASHPMASEVQRDIDYWHQMQYGGRPSEKQKQDTIESMRMQYDDYLKTAEKNWKLAQSVPDLDEATRNKYKQKYETAKGKVEALKQMHG